MLWGSFGVVHIVSLIIGIGINFAIYFILKNRSQKTQIITLFILSLSGISAIIFNLVTWGSPLQYLPLHMCSILAILLPITVLTRSRVLGNLLIIWCLGSFLAVLVNTAQADYEILSWTFFFYFFPHILEAGIPILLFRLGIVKKDYRCIPTSIGITLGIYTVVHFINLAVNKYCAVNNIVDWAGEVIHVNYMYSLMPENALLLLFRQVIPFDYFYMFMAVPLLLVYLSIVYLPDLKRAFKERKAKKERA